MIVYKNDGPESDWSNDRLYERYKTLCNPRFRRWYLKLFYFMPKVEVDRLAKESMKDTYPKIAFSKKLKAWKVKNL